MTNAYKRRLLTADLNLGGAYVVNHGYGLRGITTVCAMRDAGYVERHAQYGDILTAKGRAARQRLLDAGITVLDCR